MPLFLFLPLQTEEGPWLYYDPLKPFADSETFHLQYNVCDHMHVLKAVTAGKVSVW